MAVEKNIRFGTDGWRGIMAWDFTFANVRQLSQALADFILSKMTQTKKTSFSVIVSYDNRFLSDKFAGEISKVLASNKISVTLTETPLPTPAVSLLTEKKFNMGIVVTASHNPFQYNGVKIKFNGFSATKEITDKMEALLGKHSPLIDSDAVVKTKDFSDDYIKQLKAGFNLPLIKKCIKKPIVIDYMHGSQIGFFEKILNLKKLTVLRDNIDPLFSDSPPEPSVKNLKELASQVKKQKALAGFAFDGDGDRISVIDENGNYLNPGQVFAVIVKYLIENKKLKGKLVQTVSMGQLAKKVSDDKKNIFEEVPVGFKNVSQKMKEEKILAGAEESGGYTWRKGFLDRDGLAAALMLLEIISKTKKTLSQLVKEIESKYGKSVFVRKDFKITKSIDKDLLIKRLEKKLPKRIASLKILETRKTDGLKVVLEENSWFLIRLSDTEQNLRIYAESSNPKATDELIAYAEKVSAKYIS